MATPSASTPSSDRNLLGQVSAALDQVGLEAARAALRDALALAPPDRDSLAWSLLAQELGEIEIGLAELRRARIARPDDSEIAAELEALEEDLGDGPAGEGEAAEPKPEEVDALPSGAAPAETVSGGAGALVTTPDLVRFLHLFAGREDMHARQRHDPRRGTGYSPVPGPITPSLLQAHLAGTLTLGAYLLRLDATVTFFVLDLDVTRRALGRAQRTPAEADRLRVRVHEAGLELAERARALGLPVQLADSGFKGRHVIGFLAAPLPAKDVHQFGKRLVRSLASEDPDLNLEFFPKQGRHGPRGLGSLVKLPLGVHRRSGRRAHLLDANGRPVADPWSLLRAARRVEPDLLRDLSGRLRTRAGNSVNANAGPPSSPSSDPSPRPDLRHESDLYAQDGAVTALLAGCPVLATLVTRAWQARRLSHEERVVLRHSMGQLEGGYLLLLALLERCPETPPAELRAGRPQGHPISCPRVRERIPEITRATTCHCAFGDTPSAYPTPLLHLGARLGAQPPDPSHAAAGLAARCEVLLDRQGVLATELRAAQGHLARALHCLPEQRVEGAQGTWTCGENGVHLRPSSGRHA